MDGTPRFATIIAVRDEAVHIERAVASALPMGPVVVVDCGSRDDTRERAARLGAHVLEHEWLGYSAQKNWARENLPVDAEWIIHLDADETLTPELREEVWARTAQGDLPGFYIPRRFVFYGRVLRHASWYPDYQLRIFRRGKGRFEERAVHEHVVLDGTAGFLTHPLLHESLKSIDEFLSRHMRYAELEAEEISRALDDNISKTKAGRLLGSWPDRRRALKIKLWYRLPFRPLIRFVWMYIVKRGFLDGQEGLIYCELIAAYDAMIDANVFEKRLQRRDSEPV